MGRKSDQCLGEGKSPVRTSRPLLLRLVGAAVGFIGVCGIKWYITGRFPTGAIGIPVGLAFGAVIVSIVHSQNALTAKQDAEWERAKRGLPPEAPHEL